MLTKSLLFRYFGNVLATGDFRYTPSMLSSINLLENQIDICYLDNTYFNPVFSKAPSRDEALRQIIFLIDQHRSESLLFKLLLKNLGKERLLIDLVEYYRIPIVVSRKRFERLTKILEIDKKYFTYIFSETSLIFVDDEPLNKISHLLEKKKIIYIEPTGINKNNSEAKFSSNHFRVPYSDHSSYTEIISFVKKIRPKKIIPIVRKLLPNEIDTTDMSCLEKYLNKNPIKDSSHKYSLLLQSTSSTMESSRLNTIHRNQSKNRVSTPVTDRFITLRNRKIIRKESHKTIEYETPSKEQNSKKLSPKTSFESFPNKSLHFLKKKLNPSKMVKILLEPITEESRNKTICQEDSENENQIWEKINDKMDLLNFKDSDEPICHEQLGSISIKTALEQESILKRNPVVVLDKIDTSRFLNKRTEQQNSEEAISSDESICIEKTIQDKINKNYLKIDSDYFEQSSNSEKDISFSQNNINYLFFEFMNERLEKYALDPCEIDEQIRIHILDSFEF